MHSRRSGKVTPTSEVFTQPNEIQYSADQSDAELVGNHGNGFAQCRDCMRHGNVTAKETRVQFQLPRNSSDMDVDLDISKIKSPSKNDDSCNLDPVGHMEAPDSLALYGRPFGESSLPPTQSPRIYSGRRRPSHALPRTHRLFSVCRLSDDDDVRRRQSVFIQDCDVTGCQSKYSRLFAKTLAEMRKRELLPSYERYDYGN